MALPSLGLGVDTSVPVSEGVICFVGSQSYGSRWVGEGTEDAGHCDSGGPGHALITVPGFVCVWLGCPIVVPGVSHIKGLQP